jgi:hypothetical protein
MGNTMKLLVAVLLLSGCGTVSRELRSGWARVEFADGKFHKEVVCQLEKVDGEMRGSCAPVEAYLEAVLGKLHDLGMLITPKRAVEL